MDIPQYALDAASQYASKLGGGSDIINAVLYGFKMGNKARLRNNGELKPINDEYTFQRWWDLYGKKVDRDKCEVKWHNVLTKAERKAATEHTPLYVASTPDINYRKNPYSYLTGKCWKDYIPTQQPIVRADAEKFMEYFNNLYEYTDIPKLSEMTDVRKGMLDYIYTYYRNDIIDVMNKVKESPHLLGEDGKGFRASFEWIFTPANFIKIKEGYFNV